MISHAYMWLCCLLIDLWVEMTVLNPRVDETCCTCLGIFLIVLQVGFGSYLGCSIHTLHLHIITHLEMMGPIPGSK